MVPETRYIMIRLLVFLLWCGATVFCAGESNKIRLPILHMPMIDWQPLSSPWNDYSGDRLALAKKLAPAHLAEKLSNLYTIESLYDNTAAKVQGILNNEYISAQSPPNSSTFTDINYYWSVVIPPSDIEDSVLETSNARFLKLGAIQEMMLINITRQMSIDLSKVAAKLSVPVRNLSYSYDPNKWEDVVHAMVAEGIQNYIAYLDVANEDKLAALFGMTTVELRNTTIKTFIDLLPPALANKRLIDNNKVKDILPMAGISSANSSDAVIFNMVKNLTTNLTVVQFGSLYNLTNHQQEATKRTTLLQFSQSCGIPMSQILDKTMPAVVWETIGNQFRSVSCFPLLKVKGININSLPGLASPSSKTPLQILLHACNEYWKTCRFTMSLGPGDWECLDTQSLQQSAASIQVSPSEVTLLNSPTHDLVDVVYTSCGSLSLTKYRSEVQIILETMFNLTISEVETLVGLNQAQIRSSSSTLVKSFLNASSTDLGIGLDTMYNTTTKTIQELFESPVYELYEIIPYIIRSAVKSPASQLHMTGPDTLFILKLFADNATIAQYKYAAKHVLPNIIVCKNKFENDSIGNLLTVKSMSDNSVLENTTLHLLLTASGFELDTMKTIYGMNDAQISVLSLLYVKHLIKYCNLDLAAVKSYSCYNLTVILTGISTKPATCKATTFYVAAKAKQMQELESVCSFVASTSLPLMRMIEQCSNLTWRYNARVLGVEMKDWPQMDILNREKLSQYSELNKDKIKTSTLVSLLGDANSIHTTSEAYKIAELPTYNNRTRSDLYSLFSTSTTKMSSNLGDSEATIYSYAALQMVEKLQEFLKQKYTISFLSTASTIGVPLDKLKYLAPTEWHEMISPLKNEIVASGSKQLSVTETNFKLLLAITDVPRLSYSNLQLLWDTTFFRLLTGKNHAEKKTISTVQSMMGISLQVLHQETPLTFYNKYLNLTNIEMSILFGNTQTDFDIMTKFTFKELPCSCNISESQLLGVTPSLLVSSMIGKDDLTLCRPIAILVGFRSLSIDSLKAKFNITFNDTESFLTVAQSLSDLPYEKISWGLGSHMNDWPLLQAVSMNDYATAKSTNTSTLTNLSFHNISALIVENKNSFTPQVHALHISLVEQASSLFNVSSSDVCGQCAISSADVLKTFLYHLGGIVYLDPRVIPLVSGFDCITHDSFVLQPSKWSLLLPGIIPQSFKNISKILNISENKLENILGFSRSEIFNMTLSEYIQLVTSRVKPMVACYRTVNTDNTLTKVLAKGKDITFMKEQTFIQTLSLICSDVDVYNMTSIMGWQGTNLSILHNYTFHNAALCKVMSIKSILSRSMVALASMMINEVHNCVVIPCRSGTLRDQEYYNCTGMFITLTILCFEKVLGLLKRFLDWCGRDLLCLTGEW